MKSFNQEPAAAVAGKMGLDDLSDEQVLPLLLVMDPDTLLNFGKTSQRFFNLVCDREVWRQLLKKTAEFTKEKVEQLKAFKGSKGSEEMMPEMVKEAARRIPFSLKPMPVLEFGVWWEEEDPSWLRGIKSQVKVTLTIEGGWSNDFIEVDCNGLEELSTLARTTGVKLILVEAIEASSAEYFRNISVAWSVVVAHMEQQEVMLKQVKFKKVDAWVQSQDELTQIILPLLRLSNRWEIERFNLDEDLDDLFWTELAKVPTSSGHISSILCYSTLTTVHKKHLNTLRNLWQICRSIRTYERTNYGGRSRDFLGGKVYILDPEAEWQRVLDTLDDIQ